MSDKKQGIIIDIDGTFGYDPAASNYVYTNPKNVDWRAWNLSRVDLPINGWCRSIIEIYVWQGYHIIYLTGRSEADMGYEVTKEWLDKNSPTPKYSLIMRPPGIFGKDVQTKLDLYKELVEPQYNIALAIDDKREICKMWQEQGINTLYCGDMSILTAAGIENG
jgi:predicted secreted acid phosphatase